MSASEISLHENRSNWYYLAPNVWRVFVVAYLWLFICIIIDWKIDSAGGVLVGACVAAEIFFLHSPLQHTIDCTKKDTHYQVKFEHGRNQFHTKSEDSFQLAIIRENNCAERTVSLNTNLGATVFMPDVRDCLYALATQNEKEHDYGLRTSSDQKTGKVGWAHRWTSTRVKNRINGIIAVSAIVGTVLWAYL